MCLWKPCCCRWWGISSAICNNSDESNAIHQRRFTRQKKIADCGQMDRGDKEHQQSVERTPKKINGSPKGYLLVNNKHALRKMKTNECEQGQKLIKPTTKSQKTSTEEARKYREKMGRLQMKELSPLR